MRSGGAFEVTLLDQTEGSVSVLIEGEAASMAFAQESGGHRWQRIPPTERRGRVHTSTVTVAILDLARSGGPAVLDERDVEITTTRGSGPGGQHRNKVETCVVAIHRPTGLTVRIDGRSQVQNRRLAMAVMEARLRDATTAQEAHSRNEARRGQIGTGMRCMKIRTYRTRDDMVTDHRTGIRWKLSAWLRGEV